MAFVWSLAHNSCETSLDHLVRADWAAGVINASQEALATSTQRQVTNHQPGDPHAAFTPPMLNGTISRALTTLPTKKPTLQAGRAGRLCDPYVQSVFEWPTITAGQQFVNIILLKQSSWKSPNCAAIAAALPSLRPRAMDAAYAYSRSLGGLQSEVPCPASLNAVG